MSKRRHVASGFGRTPNVVSGSSRTQVSGAASRYGLAALAAFAIVVALFASVNAFRSRPAPLAHTLTSPEAVAEAVVEAMQAGDVDRLRALALTEEEFRAHVWPDLPVSRPEVNAPFDLVWGRLHQSSELFLDQAMGALHGRTIDIKAVTFDGETSTYGEVTVHRDTELVIAGENGDRHVRLFGSMIEQDGGWKVFSYVVD